MIGGARQTVTTTTSSNTTVDPDNLGLREAEISTSTSTSANTGNTTQPGGTSLSWQHSSALVLGQIASAPSRETTAAASQQSPTSSPTADEYPSQCELELDAAFITFKETSPEIQNPHRNKVLFEGFYVMRIPNWHSTHS